MNNIIFSVLLIIIGLVIGFGLAFIINSIRGNLVSKKAENMIGSAKKGN